MKRFFATALAVMALTIGAVAQPTFTPPPNAVEATPVPGPVIGAGSIGQPTLVVPAPQVAVQQDKKGALFDVGQAFSDAAAPYINAVIQALLLAGVTWVLAQVSRFTGKGIEAKDRDALVRGLTNQAGSLLADGVVKIQNGKVSVDTAHLENAANDLLKSLPDAAKSFGLTPEFIAKRIVDFVPQTSAGAELMTQAQAPAATPPAPKPAAALPPPAPKL